MVSSRTLACSNLMVPLQTSHKYLLSVSTKVQMAPKTITRITYTTIIWTPLGGGDHNGNPRGRQAVSLGWFTKLLVTITTLSNRIMLDDANL